MKQIFKIYQLILFVGLISLLYGCGNDDIFVEGASKLNQVSAGDTIYYKYGFHPIVFIIEKIDKKNRVIIGRSSNWLGDYKDYRQDVVSFDDYLKCKY